MGEACHCVLTYVPISREPIQCLNLGPGTLTEERKESSALYH